jgi:uncharacterized membrane protein YiaA
MRKFCCTIYNFCFDHSVWLFYFISFFLTLIGCILYDKTLIFFFFAIWFAALALMTNPVYVVQNSNLTTNTKPTKNVITVFPFLGGSIIFLLVGCFSIESSMIFRLSMIIASMIQLISYKRCLSMSNTCSKPVK